MTLTELHWLPSLPDTRERLRALPAEPDAAWEAGVALANSRLDFVFTNSLDARIRRVVVEPPANLATKPIRLALLGSCTLMHLHSAIRVAGLRRGLWIDTYETDYGQYLQELSDPSSGLHQFNPTAILLALDAYHLTAGLSSAMNRQEVDAQLHEVTGRIQQVWRLAREAFRCPIIQQTALPVHPPVLGSNEHRLPGSCAGFLSRLNAELRKMADEEGVDLLAIDDRAAHDGIAHWHDVGVVVPGQAGNRAESGTVIRRTRRSSAGSKAGPFRQMPGA